MEYQRDARLFGPGPKRILSLDGGGIRGAVTLGYLERLEQLLRERHGRPDMVLRDYFDLIGGTSTGSIIAASLCMGMDVSSIIEGYTEMGGHIFEHPARWFQPRKWFRQNLLYRNRPAAIEATLQRFFGPETTLGDDQITCGMVLVTKRADTASVWPLNNNARGRYFDRNKDIPLWQVVRASSAAPTYFPPVMMRFENKETMGKVPAGAFIDGGVSLHNNPGMLLFLMATVDGYEFHWKTGGDQLLLASFGTGTSTWKKDEAGIRDMVAKNALFWGATVPDLFIRDCGNYNEMLLQLLSNSPTGRVIDREVGDLKGQLITGEPQMHYVRYNSEISTDSLRHLEAFYRKDPRKHPRARSVEDLMKMDAGWNVANLVEIGRKAAAEQMDQKEFEIHFPGNFDIGKTH